MTRQKRRHRAKKDIPPHVRDLMKRFRVPIRAYLNHEPVTIKVRVPIGYKSFYAVEHFTRVFTSRGTIEPNSLGRYKMADIDQGPTVGQNATGHRLPASAPGDGS